MQQVFVPWAEQMRTGTEGRVQVRLFNPGVLCLDAQVFAAIQTALVTMGSVTPCTFTPAMPVSMLLDYAIRYPSAKAGSRIVWRTYTETPALQEEFMLVRVLSTWISAPMLMHTCEKIVNTLSDVQGMKFVVWESTTGDLLEELGGIPVYASPDRTAPLLQMRMADGLIAPLPPLQSIGVLPCLKYTVDIPLNRSSFFLVINREVWSALAPEDKRLLHDSTGTAIAERCGAVLDTEEKRVRVELELAGHTFLPFSPLAATAWQRPIRNLARKHEKRLISLKLLPEQGLISTLEQFSAECHL